MARPSYKAAIAYIAENDAPGDDDGPEDLSGYISVDLVAYLFDKENIDVAVDVYCARHPHERKARLRAML